jgi:hypothetical protein
MVLKDYGLEPEGVDKNIHCLFHNENRPSARLFNDGSYHCWTADCQVHFNDGIGALALLEKCSYYDAVRIAEERYGYKSHKKDYEKMKAYYSIEDSIVRQVIKQKPQAFLSVYKTLDDLFRARDLEGLQKLHQKLLKGEIK